MLRRRTLIQGLLATVATPALAQNSFLTPGGSSVPGIVTMCLSSNVAVPCATGGGGSFPPNISGTQATIAADFAGQQYWASAASQASFAAWLTAIGGTYSRASSATYLQGGVVKTATANTPRFPTDLGGTPQGIRLTGSATNLHIQSSISNSIASYNPNGGALTANAGTDPSGGSAAASFIPTAVANNHTFGLSAGVSLSASTTYTWSMFVKAIGANTYNVLLDPENGPNYSWFSLAGSGSVLGNAGSGVGSIQPLANGWFLLSVTFARTTTAAAVPTFYMSDAAGGTIPAADGTSGWLVWGMNFTATPFAADYIPTTTATVTQAADAFFFPFTQTTFSALAGTNSQNLDGGGTQRILDVGGVGPIYIADATHFGLLNGIASLFLTGPAVASTAGVNKTMAAGNPTSASITSNGLVPVTGTGAIMSASPTTMNVGNSGLSSNFMYGNISQLAIWNGLVASTAEMQRLTT